MKGPSARRSGSAARYALPLTVLLLMTGVVLAMNPSHYGLFWSVFGVGLAVVGGVLTVRLFRAAGVAARVADAGHRAATGPDGGLGVGGPVVEPDARGRKTDREEEEPGGFRPDDGRPEGGRPVDTE